MSDDDRDSLKSARQSRNALVISVVVQFVIIVTIFSVATILMMASQ